MTNYLEYYYHQQSNQHVLHFLNGAQFLNAAFVLSLAVTTAIFPATKTYASE